jgi:hypothetical protein
MNRVKILASLLFLALIFPIALLQADVKTEEKSLVKFEGFLGKMMGMFGGKAAKEGIVNTVAVRGNRKAVMNDTNGEIIDLSEEKVYSLDLSKKTYTVQTFADIRRKMLDAQEKAAKAAKGEKPEARPQNQEMQMEMDFSMKESGQTKVINGFNCREVIMTIAMRQKGKTLEDGGGTVMTSNIWLAPEIPALKEIAEFDRRYWQKLDLPNTFGVDAEQMAAALAMYPGLKEMMTKSQSQQVDMKGTAILTVTTMEAVQSAQQAAAAEKKQDDQGGGGGITSVRGLGGLIGKRLAPKKDESAAKTRNTIMTMNHELLKAVNAASDSDTAIPAGFKEKK